MASCQPDRRSATSRDDMQVACSGWAVLTGRARARASHGNVTRAAGAVTSGGDALGTATGAGAGVAEARREADALPECDESSREQLSTSASAKIATLATAERRTVEQTLGELGKPSQHFGESHRFVFLAAVFFLAFLTAVFLDAFFAGAFFTGAFFFTAFFAGA